MHTDFCISEFATILYIHDTLLCFFVLCFYVLLCLKFTRLFYSRIPADLHNDICTIPTEYNWGTVYPTRKKPRLVQMLRPPGTRER